MRIILEGEIFAEVKPDLPLDLQIGKTDCLCIVTVSNEKETTIKEEVVRMPIKIIARPEEQRILVRPSKMLFFTRIAKTGKLMLMYMQRCASLFRLKCHFSSQKQNKIFL